MLSARRGVSASHLGRISPQEFFTASGGIVTDRLLSILDPAPYPAVAAASTAEGIWKAHGFSPYRWRHFKLSGDPAFAEKLTDIVSLYVDPPAHAVVLSIDEKSQIQTCDRTQPGLSMKKGRAGTIRTYNAIPAARTSAR